MTVAILLSLFGAVIIVAALTSEPVTAWITVATMVLFFCIARREIRA